MKKTKEADLMRQIQLAASRKGWRLFRNNVGIGYVGTPCTSCKHKLRKIRFGLFNGSSDLIGWDSKGHFVAGEVKTIDGILSKKQMLFLQAVIRSGGVGLVLRGPHDLEQIHVDI